VSTGNNLPKITIEYYTSDGIAVVKNGRDVIWNGSEFKFGIDSLHSVLTAIGVKSDLVEIEGNYYE